MWPLFQRNMPGLITIELGATGWCPPSSELASPKRPKGPYIGPASGVGRPVLASLIAFGTGRTEVAVGKDHIPPCHHFGKACRQTTCLNKPCLRWNSNGSGFNLWLNTVILPKVLAHSNLNRLIQLAQFDPPLGEGEKGSGLLCPMRALRAYVKATTCLWRPEQLFVCYGGPVKTESVPLDRGRHCSCIQGK